MRGFQPATSATTKKKFPHSGPVRGPGTGTSDEVQDEVPQGTYIMPTDSTQAIGEQNLAGMGMGEGEGAQMPVNLSNGEFKLPPDQVHAVGVQALDAMKNATHTPVARGFAPAAQQNLDGEPRMFFADGGVVDEEAKRKPISPSNIFPQGSPSAGANIYGGAIQAVKDRIGSSGQFAKVPDSIGQQPGRTPRAPDPVPVAPVAQRTDAERQALVNQIPTGGVQSPARAATPAQAPVAQAAPVDLRPSRGLPNYQAPDLGAAASGASNMLTSAFPGTTAAVQGSMEDTRQAYQQAGLGGALGMAARTAMTPVVGLADDVMRSASRVLDPAAQALKTAVTGDATPIGQQQAAPAAVGVPPKPAVNSGAAPVATNQPQAVASTTSPPAASAEAAPQAAAMPQATQVEPGIYRTGNSFSDSAAGAMAGAQPRGLPSAQNMAAADALAQRSQQDSMTRVLTAQARGLPTAAPQMRGPTATHSGNDWTARQALDRLKTAANGIHRTSRERQQAQAAYQQGLQADYQAMTGQSQLDAKAMEVNAGLQREGMSQQGANQRTAMAEQGAGMRDARRAGLDERRLNMDETVKGFDVRQAQYQEALRQRYQEAKTPAEREALVQQIRDLSGKEVTSRFTVVPGGQEWDQQAGAMRNVPARVFNNQSGQFADQQSAARSQAPAIPQERGKRVVGQTYALPDGRTVRWTEAGGVPL